MNDHDADSVVINLRVSKDTVREVSKTMFPTVNDKLRKRMEDKKYVALVRRWCALWAISTALNGSKPVQTATMARLDSERGRRLAVACMWAHHSCATALKQLQDWFKASGGPVVPYFFSDDPQIVSGRFKNYQIKSNVQEKGENYRFTWECSNKVILGSFFDYKEFSTDNVTFYASSKQTGNIACGGRGGTLAYNDLAGYGLGRDSRSQQLLTNIDGNFYDDAFDSDGEGFNGSRVEKPKLAVPKSRSEENVPWSVLVDRVRLFSDHQEGDEDEKEGIALSDFNMEAEIVRFRRTDEPQVETIQYEVGSTVNVRAGALAMEKLDEKEDLDDIDEFDLDDFTHDGVATITAVSEMHMELAYDENSEKGAIVMIVEREQEQGSIVLIDQAPSPEVKEEPVDVAADGGVLDAVMLGQGDDLNVEQDGAAESGSDRTASGMPKAMRLMNAISVALEAEEYSACLAEDPGGEDSNSIVLNCELTGEFKLLNEYSLKYVGSSPQTNKRVHNTLLEWLSLGKLLSRSLKLYPTRKAKFNTRVMNRLSMMLSEFSYGYTVLKKINSYVSSILGVSAIGNINTSIGELLDELGGSQLLQMFGINMSITRVGTTNSFIVLFNEVRCPTAKVGRTPYTTVISNGDKLLPKGAVGVGANMLRIGRITLTCKNIGRLVRKQGLLIESDEGSSYEPPLLHSEGAARYYAACTASRMERLLKKP